MIRAANHWKTIVQWSLDHQRIIRLALIIVTTVIFVSMRMTNYGDLRLSIGAGDTSPYLGSSLNPVLSTQFFSGQRPPTVPLLYKILEPEEGYQTPIIIEPAIDLDYKDKVYQPGFDRIVIAQQLLSMFCWSLLAWVVFWRFKTLWVSLCGALIIFLFAFAPQLAEWDFILLSESLSFSLYALYLALTIELLFRYFHEKSSFSLITKLLFGFWLVSVCLWAETRDTNTYALLLINLFLAVVLLLPPLRKRAALWPLIGTIVFFSVFFVFNQNMRHQSRRGILPLQSSLITNVFPYEDRVGFFEQEGMPIVKNILIQSDYFAGPAAMRQSDQFMDWLYKNGTSAYIKFLLDYPLWASLELYNNLDFLFYENLQPWFTGPASTRSLWLIRIGDILHAKSSAVVFLDLLLILALMITAVRSGDTDQRIWAAFFSWQILILLSLFFISFHGDPRSTTRHTLVAVMPLRLYLWILLLILIDFSMTLTNRVTEK